MPEKTFEESEADSVMLNENGGNRKSVECGAESAKKFLKDTVYDSDYGKNIEGLLEKPKCMVQRIVEKYENSRVKPYIGTIDMNKGDDDLNELKPNVAYEIGLKIDF